MEPGDQPFLHEMHEGSYRVLAGALLHYRRSFKGCFRPDATVDEDDNGLGGGIALHDGDGRRTVGKILADQAVGRDGVDVGDGIAGFCIFLDDQRANIGGHDQGTSTDRQAAGAGVKAEGELAGEAFVASFLTDLEASLHCRGGCGGLGGAGCAGRFAGGRGYARELVGVDHFSDASSDLDDYLAHRDILTDLAVTGLDFDGRDEVTGGNRFLDGDIRVERVLPSQDAVASGNVECDAVHLESEDLAHT